MASLGRADSSFSNPTLASANSPLIIGHRGASAVAPENTLAAFARTLDAGADGVELDVRLARDGVPVVIHDATLKRTGLRDGAVGRMTSSELAAIDAGTWFNREHPALSNDDYAREGVPTLERVFQLVIGRDSSKPLFIYVELKTDNKACDELVRSVVNLVNRYKFKARVVIVSLDLSALTKTKLVDSTIRTGALFAPRQGARLSLQAEDIITAAAACGADEILLHRLIARPKLVQAAISRDLPVAVWTVDDPVWIQRADKLGVSSLITNDPALLVARRG